MIRGAGAGAAMGASGEVKAAVFLWIWAVDEGAYDTAVIEGRQSPVGLRPPCRFKGLGVGRQKLGHGEGWGRGK